TPEVRAISEMIAISMGLPPEICFGGLSYCLVGSSFVSTDSGTFQLGDLAPAESETSATLNCNMQGPRRVAKAGLAHNVGYKRVFRLRTRHGLEIEGAPTHPVLTLGKDLEQTWKTLEELKAGDFVGAHKGGNLWP